jgi:hypothetical protein
MVWASPPPTAYICFCTSFVCTYPRREIIIETIAATRGPRAMRSGAVFSETVVRPPSAWSNSARAPPARIGRRGESSAGTPLRADAFAGFRRGADSFTVDNTLRPRCHNRRACRNACFWRRSRPRIRPAGQLRQRHEGPGRTSAASSSKG